MLLIDVNKLPEEPEPEYVFGLEDRYKQLRSINPSMSDDEIYSILEYSYELLLTKEASKKDKDIIRSLFVQEKVLKALSNIVYRHKDTMPYEQRVYLNKILYSMVNNNIADTEAKMKYMVDIATYNNYNQAIALASMIPKKESAILCIMRYSSFKEMSNVQRVNDYIIRILEPAENAEQVIVHIYDVLFQRVTYLFEGTMIDVKDTSKMTESEREIYGTQGLAILDVIEQMPMQYIDRVIKTYYEDLNMVFKDFPTRFSLLSIAACDYPRITDSNRRISAEGCYNL